MNPNKEIIQKYTCSCATAFNSYRTLKMYIYLNWVELCNARKC